MRRSALLSELSVSIRHLKEIMKATFDRYCETVQFHLLAHVEKYYERFLNLQTLMDRPLKGIMCK